MEKDFHHHIIYTLAKLSGFNRKMKGYDESEAKIIAYASQYVDDNCDRQYSMPHDSESYPITLPKKLETESPRNFYPLLTQAVDIKALDLKIQFYVFMPFHFLPGDYKQVGINGVSNPYCTTRNSTTANKLVDDALASKDPYRIGIALHTYADTWSHERFTAFEEKWNKVLDWYKDFKSLAPNIGHADVWHSPDQICKTWRDHRFNEGSIINREKVLQAAENIYKKLMKKGKGTPWNDIKDSVKNIIYLDSSIDVSDEKKVYDERKERIEKLIGEPLDYEKDKWVSQVIEFDLSEAKDSLASERGQSLDDKPAPINIRLKRDFENSHWYRFQVAAKIQLGEVLKLTSSL